MAGARYLVRVEIDPNPVPEVTVRRLVELVVTLVIGAGLPLSQLTIRHLRRPGAAAVAATSAGILVADVAALASGGDDANLRRILRLEAGAAALATVTGVILLLDPEVREARDEGWEMGRAEMLRRLSLGLVFGILSARVRVQSDMAAHAAQAPEGADSQG